MSQSTAFCSRVKSCVVALVGNPNTGKTTLFNALSGLHQRVGNYPGVTVETKKGRFEHDARDFELIDLPGTYSLAPRSPDEMVAVDVILGRQAGETRPDVVVSIVDASNLERNLYLTTQVMELGVPVVVALNMVDVAKKQGITIDSERLSRQLGVPVVPVQANKKRGLLSLKEAIVRAASAGCTSIGVVFPELFEHEAEALQTALAAPIPSYLIRRLLLDVGGYTAKQLADHHIPSGIDVAALLESARARLAAGGCTVPSVEARTRYAWIRQALAGCVDRPEKRPVAWTDRFDRVLTHPVWGTVFFLSLMFIVFQSIFEWARPLMKLIAAGKDTLADALRAALPPGPLASLLIDGCLEGVGAVVIFLPQIAILFGFIAFLEDCGYMARAAFLMDKLMARCGLSGKSFIPLLSSVACAVPGIMATRVIENPRDRLTTILVAPLMSCSARLPVYTLLIAAFLPVRDLAHPDGYAWWVPGLAMFGLYGIGLVAAPLMALIIKRTVLRGETPVFVMEMPMYKLPSLAAIGRRMIDSAWAFLRRAGTLILASMILVWAFLYFPSTDAEGTSYEQRIATLEGSSAQLRQELEALSNPDGPTNQRNEIETRNQLIEDETHRLKSEWKSRSVLGRMGHWIEPVVRPLGWDWRIGMAALASFPAREVVVGTLGIIYQQGKVDTEEMRQTKQAGESSLARALQDARWDHDGERRVFSIPTALSLMVFFALCCQCVSTLAVIRRETNSWFWPAFTFTYMTILAYVGAWLTYCVSGWFFTA